MTGHPELSQLRPQPPQAQHGSPDSGIILHYILPSVVTRSDGPPEVLLCFQSHPPSPEGKGTVITGQVDPAPWEHPAFPPTKLSILSPCQSRPGSLALLPDHLPHHFSACS